MDSGGEAVEFSEYVAVKVKAKLALTRGTCKKRPSQATENVREMEEKG